jgi:hypothetical protein
MFAVVGFAAKALSEHRSSESAAEQAVIAR